MPRPSNELDAAPTNDGEITTVGFTHHRLLQLASLAVSLAACTPKAPNNFRLPNIPGSWRTQGALGGELGNIVRVQTLGRGTTVHLVKTGRECGLNLRLGQHSEPKVEPKEKDSRPHTQEPAGNRTAVVEVKPKLEAAVGWDEVKRLLLRGSHKAASGLGAEAKHVRENTRKLEYKAKAYRISIHQAVDQMNDECVQLLLRKSGDENPFRLVVGILALDTLQGNERLGVDARASSRGTLTGTQMSYEAQIGQTSSVSSDYLFGAHVAGLKLAMTCEGALDKQDLSAHMVEDRWGWNGHRDCRAFSR